MSVTYGELKTRVAGVLNDPSNRTFTTALVEELIESALVEVGRIVPEQFTEDLTPVAYQLTYALRSDEFGGEAVPEIDVKRVEVWDPTTDPETYVYTVQPMSTEYARGSDSGWAQWGGQLYLPTRVVSGLVGYEDQYVIRVWGYSPYAIPTADEDVIAVSKLVEQAMLWFIRAEALELLLASRDLFTQWQTRSGNSDMTPAGLMNQKSIAEQAWTRRSRSIAHLRSEV